METFKLKYDKVNLWRSEGEPNDDGNSEITNSSTDLFIRALFPNYTYEDSHSVDLLVTASLEKPEEPHYHIVVVNHNYRGNNWLPLMLIQTEVDGEIVQATACKLGWESVIGLVTEFYVLKEATKVEKDYDK